MDSYNGRNILSCKPGTRFYGKEIKEWIKWHIDHETSKQKIAKQMERFLNIEDDQLYYLTKGNYSSSSSMNKYLVVRDGV